MKIYEKLKNRRNELKLTLDDVAKAVGVNHTTVYRWENGEIENIRSNKIIALAKVLKLSPIEIICQEQDLEYHNFNNIFGDIITSEKTLEAYSTKTFEEFLQDLDYTEDLEAAFILNKNKGKGGIEIISIHYDTYKKMIEILKNSQK